MEGRCTYSLPVFANLCWPAVYNLNTVGGEQGIGQGEGVGVIVNIKKMLLHHIFRTFSLPLCPHWMR